MNRPMVAVIGAGAFGGWTALQLLRKGARVQLFDAWGPGNSRASSGGESRIMRATYGGSGQPYTMMSLRALQLWQEYERDIGLKLLHQTGVLWMARHEDDRFERESVAALQDAGVAFEQLKRDDIVHRWPQINPEGVDWAIFEPQGGFLTARAACRRVVETFVRSGGEYRQIAVAAEGLDESWEKPKFSDASVVEADFFVFACGPWMGKLFPRTIGKLIRPTKQDVLFFGTPSHSHSFSEGHLPVWADHGASFFYGMPAHAGQGFKIASDTRGPEFDPTHGERLISEESLRAAREYIAFRFPSLKDAPLLESRVCQYEDTPDANFIVDRHPANETVWLAGGGSGHGFKHGPAVGEMLAEMVLEDKKPEPLFQLTRFRRA